MLSLHTAFDVQLELKDFIKQRRKQQKLSVEALAQCSGVPYSTIRKFENTGNISLRQFLMFFSLTNSNVYNRLLYFLEILEGMVTGFSIIVCFYAQAIFSFIFAYQIIN